MLKQLEKRIRSQTDAFLAACEKVLKNQKTWNYHLPKTDTDFFSWESKHISRQRRTQDFIGATENLLQFCELSPEQPYSGRLGQHPLSKCVELTYSLIRGSPSLGIRTNEARSLGRAVITEVRPLETYARSLESTNHASSALDADEQAALLALRQDGTYERVRDFRPRSFSGATGERRFRNVLRRLSEDHVPPLTVRHPKTQGYWAATPEGRRQAAQLGKRA